MKNYKLFIIFSVLLISCNNSNQTIIDLPKEASFKITPPLLDAVPIAEIFEIDNSEDTILFSDNGSYISIPKDCFVDDIGNSVSDPVSIYFNEYQNPADILLSGIPMVYMENKDTMDFQSAGMCEVLASVNNEQIQLKKNKTIGIGLRNLAQENDYNLYYFDTIKGNWIEKEKSIPLIKSNELPIKPVNLQKSDSDKIVTVNIEKYKIRPLYKMWHKSKFHVYGEQTLIESDSSVWWYDMGVKETNNKDLYKLTFIGVNDNSDQCKYDLIVQPTIDSANYEIEMELFYQNMKAYITEIELIKTEIAQNTLEGQKIEAEWAENRRLDSLRYVQEWIKDSLRVVQQKANDSIRVVQAELWKAQNLELWKTQETRVEVMRSFTIKQMGIYNCDRFYKRMVVTNKQIGFVINNQLRQFDQSYLINKYDNAVLSYVPFYANHYSIGLNNQQYSFVGIMGGKIYHTFLKLSDSNENSYDMSATELSIEEFKNIMK